MLDALEDNSEQHVWRWQLRDNKTLAKGLRKAAIELRKQLNKVWCVRRGSHVSASEPRE